MEVAPLVNQVQYDVTITTTEMHTGGECVRIIESGYPVPHGKTILDKINYLRENLDAFRKLLIFEPRGHYDMFGVLLVAPDHPDADIAAIFMHNEGYTTMCGHAVISLGRYAVDRGRLKRPLTSPETRVNIQTPCGLVQAFVQIDSKPGRKSGRVRFRSVPCFVVAVDVDVNVKGVGQVRLDVVYGGAFFAFVTARDVGIDLDKALRADLLKVAAPIKEAVAAAVPVSHPEVPAFLYGVIFVDSRDDISLAYSTNICVFANDEIDRSPCGSGTSARVALMYFKGLLKLGQEQVFRSGVTGAEFIGRALSDTEVAGKKAVVTEVEGQGHYSGSAVFNLERDDIMGRGFLVR